jgi:hypothetical protein
MAMSSSGLAASMKNEILAIPGITINDTAELEKFCTALSTAVVDHIKSNAVVTVQPGISVSTTGSAAAQTGATTGTGTGSVA